MYNLINSFLNGFVLVPEIFLVINVMVLIFFVFAKKIKTMQLLYTNTTFNPNSFVLKNVIFFSLFLCFASIILSSLLFDQFFLYSFLAFVTNNFVISLKILIFFFSAIILIFAQSYFDREFTFKSIEFFIVLLLSLISMCFLLSCNDFLSLYIALELQSLCFYILAGFKQQSILSIESGLKYFVLGSFASGLLLFGVSLIYGTTGSINFFDVGLYLAANNLRHNSFTILFGLLLIISALLFKFTAAPFHMWSPDVYDGAPTIITFFFSVVPKIVFFGLLIRLFNEIFLFLDEYLLFLFTTSSVLSLILGSITSLYQVKIKRFLAYSSISNVGFFLLALNCTNKDGFVSGLLYLFVYLMVTTGVFSFLLSLRYSNNNLKLKNINELAGLLMVRPGYSIFFLINFFSLIGIPPLSGFVGKFYLFLSSIIIENFFLFFFAVFASIFSSVIYLRIVRLIFFNKQIYFYSYKTIDRAFLILSIIVFVLNLFFIFFADEFFKFFYSIISVNV